MSDVSERTVWTIKVLIEATAEEADEAVDVIAGALCPDETHPGECAMPWTTGLCRLEELDADERVMWAESFADDRAQAQQAAESDLGGPER